MRSAKFLPFLVLPLLSGCPSGKTALVGAGATFPYPLYSRWVAEYERVNPAVEINYQSVGSGAGIRQLTERTVDFGASDAPMTDEALAKAGGKVQHIPMTLGAVVATYNLPGVSPSLRIAPDVLADIYLGKIKSWDDPRLAADNPDVKLPATPIVPVYRADGSGTTFIFTDYLCKVSPSWKDAVGKGTSVKFPQAVGVGAKGNEGVTGQVMQMPGGLGYVELIYALENKLPVATLRNRAGKWVAPSIDSVTAAAATAEIPDDLRVSITDAPGDAAYPISSFTWILVPADYPDAAKGKALLGFLEWALTSGQADSPDLHYAPLPASVAERSKKALHAITCKGQPLASGG